MKKLLLAAVAGFGLVSASPPDSEEGAPEARSGYPPCSARVTDECIQLYERGVRRPENLAENRHRPRHRADMEGAEEDEEAQGVAEAQEDARAHSSAGSSHYPPCTATVKDECRQHRALARRIRMAGERG